MAENSPYFESITAARSMRVKDHEAFVDETISMETQSDLARDSVGESLQTNFALILPRLRLLSPEDQELLFSYFFLAKPQWCLAKLYRSTQTLCSLRIRMALKKLGIVMIYNGHPSQEELDDILESHSLNALVEGVKTSTLIVEYRSRRSFAAVADALRLHRPAIRRALTQVVSVLMDDPHEEHKAVGAYVHGLVDKASIQGQGYSAKKVASLSHVHKTDPALVGAFHIDLADPAFEEHVLVSRASN